MRNFYAISYNLDEYDFEAIFFLYDCDIFDLAMRYVLATSFSTLRYFLAVIQYYGNAGEKEILFHINIFRAQEPITRYPAFVVRRLSVRPSVVR